jgi:hypothetical protein
MSYKGPTDVYLSLNSDLASSVSENGSTFSVNFTPALTLPPNAQNVSVALIQSTIWWTIPNFQACVIQVYVADEKKGEVNVPVQIPKGIYNYKQINVLIGNALEDQQFPRTLVQFVENGATSTIDLVFSAPGALLFPSGSCEKQFGYDGNVRYEYTGLLGAASKFIRAPRTASFDTIQYLTIGTDLVDDGFRLNGGVFRGVIANVVVNALPGYQITAEPATPLEVASNVFEGAAGRTRATFHLMDQDGNAVDTNGEAWTLLLRIRYWS